ncbi:MAG: bifunctional ornithine acetyltransferase/N-acetylglutamate synthase, partial [Chloroflexales bacterium]|nr:bifunctional ornithine acetyltransferase/N-acetylglutamate synthase [Chloroflexales bacterium]
SGAELNPDQVVLHFGGLKVLERGQPLDFDEQAAHTLLDQAEIVIEADLGLGVGNATVWTCDFSYEYVRINAEYRT